VDLWFRVVEEKVKAQPWLVFFFFFFLEKIHGGF
jgi:hypothetical protein